MICPKCNKSNSETAKFCSGCGTRLAPPAEENVRKPAVPLCGNCGKPLKPGARFCVFCGTAATEDKRTGETGARGLSLKKPAAAVDAPPLREKKAAEDDEILPRPESRDSSSTVLLYGESSREKETKTALLQETSVIPAAGRGVMMPGAPAGERSLPPAAGNRSSNGGQKLAIVLFVAAGCLFAAALVAALIFLRPAAGGTQAEDTARQDGGEPETETEAAVDVVKEEIPEAELQALEERIGQGKEELENAHYEDETGCMAILESVMGDCTEYADQYKKSSGLQETAQEAFQTYTEAVMGQVALLFGQDVRPELYAQMESDLNAGLEQAEKLRNAGFEIDTKELDEKLSSLEGEYADRYIERFNRFTEGENWSRTESWALMNDAESIGLVDYGNMDDPMTQRYAYALARVTLKTVETGLNDGSMGYEDAAEELFAVLKDSDYNLLLMYELAGCLEAAGRQEEAENMYESVNAITEQIYETQGLYVGHDIPLDHFWIFNEFESEYPVDSQNGLSKSNHEWIRNYMEQRMR